MEEPVCLIDTGPDGRLRVQQGALQILEQIQQPVVVVAVVGLYRTGKSYLMNRLALRRKGFALGSTVESKTKGIWMWCMPHPSKCGNTLVLLDTEGLGDVEKGDEKHDMWIFFLAVLLSSTLVYNSMGTIDNVALEKLHFVTELTEHIRVKSTNDGETTELMRVFPSFVWTVRDFMLELELDTKPISADEYLEHSMRLKTGSSRHVVQLNRVRQSLRDFFLVRRCFVMERPASSAKMKRVEQLTDADLEPSFVEQANDFCSYIYHEAQVKTMRGGRELTGRTLGDLAEHYVEAIRSGQVLCLESAVESLAKIQNSRAVAEALGFYQAEMAEKVQFPTETQEALSKVHMEAEQQAISKFMKASFHDPDEKHLLQLRASLEGKYRELCKRNVKESHKLCWEVLRQVFASLEDGISSGSFMRPGGYEEYRSELDRGVEHYRSKTGKGLMGEEVLVEYLEEKHVVGKTILIADESLTELQRKAEGERNPDKVKVKAHQGNSHCHWILV
ncbi:guanylate-binding protein 1-like [Engraulis encrasicolus]|uniref:guanylate-binding protein 1-like n=1 Tax=Engraulis encrasicolus TaxID=184585 RepID=UPI002FD0AE01